MNWREEIVRLQSYQNWPHRHWSIPIVTPRNVAATGFYYTSFGDRVTCFDCGLQAENSKEYADPHVIHQQWQFNCRFIKNQFCGNVPIGENPGTVPRAAQKLYPSQYYIQEAPELQMPWRCDVTMETKTPTAELIYSAKFPQTSKDDKYPHNILNSLRIQNRNPLICKICLENNLNIAFIPCGHSIACQPCAIKVNRCCYCRIPITNQLKLFI